MKKTISILLVLLTIFSVTAGLSFNSSALTSVWEKEPNNEEIQANNFGFGQAMNANLSSIFDYDFFKVSVKTNVKFRVKFEHEYTDNINYDYWEVDVDRYNSSTGEYKDCTGMTVGDFESTRKTEVITARAGEKFMISIWENNGASPLDYQISLEPVISKVSGVACKARTTSSQKIGWKAAPSATGYQVQRSNNGGKSWSSYYYTSSNAYTFKSLTAGGKYKFRVRAYQTIEGTKYYGAWSNTICSCCTPAKPTLKSVSSPKHAQIKTVWAKASGTKTGYQILYGKNSSFSSIAARKNVSSSLSSYTGKNFTKGKTYYVKVRTYTTFNGKAYYSAWSATKKVKCK